MTSVSFYNLSLIENDLSADVSKSVEDFNNSTFDPEALKTKFNNWNTSQKVLYLQKIISEKPYTSKQKDLLQVTLDLTNEKLYNMEVRFNWILNELARKTDEGKQFGIQFVSKIGRMKFVQPIFVGIYKYDPVFARNNWDLLKNTYHSFVQNRVEDAFAKIKPTQVNKFLALE